MLPLLHDLLAARPGPLARLDARAPLLLAAALLLACLGSSGWPLPAGIGFAAVAGGLALRVPPLLLLARLAVPLLMVAVLAAIRLHLQGRAGLAEAGLLASRVLGASAVLVLLGSTVPVPRLAAALRWLRVPALLVELLLLIYRFTFVLLDRAESGADALRLRLGWADRRRRLASSGQLAGLVLLRAVDQSARTAEAMRLRGGPGRLPLAPLGRPTYTACAATATGLAAVGASWWLWGRA